MVRQLDGVNPNRIINEMAKDQSKDGLKCYALQRKDSYQLIMTVCCTTSANIVNKDYTEEF